MDNHVYQPPPIEPVPGGIHRSLWSVMIPTYNCAKYLRQTLESVLVQDPGSEQMQIEVVDDCSTKDDPEAVVREVGNGRVTFYRKPHNEGATANFNTCIQRSRGHLVHILHGDDYVLPGFYKRVSTGATAHPDVMAFFVRSFAVDEDGALDWLSARTKWLEQPARFPGELLYNNYFLTPGVVLRRSLYEENGGFLPTLLHVADWEMWIRGITLGCGVMINEPLAVYRFFAGNDTGRLSRTAENLRDCLRLADILSERFLEFDHTRFKRLIAQRAQQQAKRFRECGDDDAVAANRRLWQELTQQPVSFQRAIKNLGRTLIRS